MIHKITERPQSLSCDCSNYEERKCGIGVLVNLPRLDQNNSKRRRTPPGSIRVLFPRLPERPAEHGFPARGGNDTRGFAEANVLPEMARRRQFVGMKGLRVCSLYLSCALIRAAVATMPRPQPLRASVARGFPPPRRDGGNAVFCTKPLASMLACNVGATAHLGPRFEDHVERGFRRPADSGKPALGEDLSQALLAGLRSEREANFLA